MEESRNTFRRKEVLIIHSQAIRSLEHSFLRKRLLGFSSARREAGLAQSDGIK